MNEYSPNSIESKWKQSWKESDLYKVAIDNNKPKYYVLDMFPYPSGAGLHVGHPLGYIASDIFSRYKTMKGFNVLHPMGFDAFGLPAEQYAIQSGVHPAKSTEKNMVQYVKQLSNLGFNYDWSQSVTTCEPEYYKWTQWIFIQLFEHYYDTAADKAMPIASLIETFAKAGNKDVKAATTQEADFTADEWKGMTPLERDELLMNYRIAYRKISYVNWCEELGTVLANDEVKDGLSERGGYPVERRAMKQWSLRITAYAERLLTGLDSIDWSDALKAMQRNWIGRSEGAQVYFDIEGHNDKIEVFTTRPDTIYGATFMVLAPEHDLVAQLTTDDQKESIEAYIDYANSRSERERMSEVKIVGGAFTGAYAINPFTGKKVPIWIAEYVLKDYGTGAIMAVPSDDDRDQRFAEKFEIEIINVVDKSKYPNAESSDKVGTMINSGDLNGLEVKDAIQKALDLIEERKVGKRMINYRLRDANYSRQRYWGEPFPIYYDKDGVTHALKEEELPLTLPDLDDFKPASGGKSPLARAESWLNLPDGAIRETDTMPAFAGSSWYFLRYMDAKNDEAIASKNALDYWQDVDLYIGGTEHAVGHLLYSRCWHKFLFDLDIVPTEEPFKKLVNQGMIQGVIEFILLQKEPVNGKKRFVSKALAEKENIDCSQIPVHIDFVKNYGSDNSYLDQESIEQFIAWRPEYGDAIYETTEGIYQNGTFQGTGAEAEYKMVTVSEVGKMSKSKYNVVNPDDVVARYGADCFRMYEMFLGPIEQSKPWDTKGIDGVSKFLRKYWSLFYNENGDYIVEDAAPTDDEYRVLHNTIKKVDNYIQKFAFNTGISAFMICVNELKKLKCHKLAILKDLTVLMAPFAPFITEELWSKMGHTDSIHKQEYSILNEEYLKEDSVEYPVSVNGKKRASLTIASDASKADIEAAAKGIDEVQKWLDGKDIKKVIVVPGRMVNIVV